MKPLNVTLGLPHCFVKNFIRLRSLTGGDSFCSSHFSIFVLLCSTDKEQVARVNGALRAILEDSSFQRFPRERDIFTRMLANFLATEQNEKVSLVLLPMFSLWGFVEVSSQY